LNIDVVIAQIRQLCPIFGGNVAGAAGYVNGVADQVWLPLPAAYVTHLGETAERNESSTDSWQIIHERIGVIVVLDVKNVGGVYDVADRRAQAVSAYLDTVRKSLWRAIYNWRPDWDPANPQANREARGIYILDADFPQGGGYDRARFFYQFDFGLDTLVTGADGWQMPFEPLVKITGTIPGATPASAPVEFATQFPPPETS
jgi:hypothetical protein